MVLKRLNLQDAMAETAEILITRQFVKKLSVKLT